MTRHVAPWDRVLRIVLGAALLYLGWIVLNGLFAGILIGLGVVALLTGLVGTCPVYALFEVELGPGGVPHRG